MNDSYGALVVPLLLPAFVIASGLILIYRKDWAWRFVEWWARSVKPQRTPEWEINSTINGVVMLVLGLLFAVFLLYQIFFA